MKERIASRVLVGSGLLALLVAIAFALLIATIAEQRDALGDAVEAERVVSQANDVERQVVDLETGQRGFLVTNDPGFLEPFERARGQLPVRLQELRAATASDPVAGREVERIQRGVDNYLEDYALPLIDLGRRDLEAGRARVRSGEGKRRMDALRRRFDLLADSATSAAAERRRDADDRAAEATVLGIACALGSMLLIGLFGLYVTRTIARPLRRVARAADAVASGDLTARAGDAKDAPAELGAMARAFDAMADSLEQGRDELESQNAELERQQAELERALTDLEQEKERIGVLHGFGELLAQETGPETLSSNLLRRLADLAQAEVGAVYLTDPESAGLSLAATRGLKRELVASTLDPGEGLAWRALEERRVVAAAHADAALELELLGGRLAVAHELHLPLSQGQRPIAVVTLARTADRPFAAEEVELLERLGEQAAVALANARSTEAVHEAAAALRLQLQRFGAVLRGARGYAIVSTDPDGIITVFNEGAERMLGYGAEELVQRETPGVFHDHAEVVARARELGMEPGFGVFVHDATKHPGEAREWTYVRKDGSRFPVRLTLSALRGERGEALGFMGIAEDVTEHRGVERRRAALLAGTRALAEAGDEREALVRLLEALMRGLDWDAGLWWAVEDGALRCAEAWAKDPEQARRLSDCDAELAESVRAGGAAVWVEQRDGDPLPAAAAVPLSYGGDVCGVIELRAAAPRPSSERELDLLSTLSAQTGHYLERKRAEREAERLKDEFFALVSHELRTPLTSIVGYVETLADLEAERLSDDGRHFLGVVTRNAGQLERLVDDLLLMAQIDAGKLSLQHGQVDIEQIAADAVDAAKPRADANAVELRLRADSVPELEGDPGRLRQALDNLVSNAIKFSPQGGVVEVSLDTRPHDVAIAVSDTGVGIPEADQQQLFTRFFRASTAEHIGGVGLGLTIVKAIAEGHGGSVSVESREGEGTTFTVELPRDGSPQAGQRQAQEVGT